MCQVVKIVLDEQMQQGSSHDKKRCRRRVRVDHNILNIMSIQKPSALFIAFAIAASFHMLPCCMERDYEHENGS